jgi:hypothetical protein
MALAEGSSPPDSSQAGPPRVFFEGMVEQRPVGIELARAVRIEPRALLLHRPRGRCAGVLHAG